MLIIVALSCGIAIVGLITFIVMCLGIRQDDRSARLDGPAAGRAARLARRFTGLRTEQPAIAGPRARRRTREHARADW